MKDIKPALTVHFAELDDPRVIGKTSHLLIDIIVIAICSVIAGATGWEQIEIFGKARQEWFSGFFERPYGIPGHDTFRRVLSRVNAEQFQNWVHPDTTLTPFGILLPATGDNHLWFSKSKVTADFIVDRLVEMIPKWKKRFALQTLVINADNGPESSGRRTQWLKRLVELPDTHQLTIRLAYYPPYHCKYNPVERLWGVLENHWRGEIIDTGDKALGQARTMTYRGINPIVRKVIRTYKTGKSLSKKIMKQLETRLERKPGPEKWFFTIVPQAQTR